MNGGTRSDPVTATSGRASARLRLPVLIIWLTLVWAMLWGDFGAGSLLSGIVVALVAVFIARPTGVRGLQLTSFHPLAALVFASYFALQLVTSCIAVAREVITPWPRMNRAIVAIPMHVVTPGLVTLVGNAITLTPGTLTVDVRQPTADEPPVLYVHALHFDDLDSIRRDVLRLERLAVRAFGTDQQRRDVDLAAAR